MQRKYFVPQRLAVNEERLFPQDASDRELLHLGQAAVLLQDVKNARDALRLLAVVADAAVGHHLARVDIPDLVRALAQSGGNGGGSRAGLVGGDLEGRCSLSTRRAVHVHAVRDCRISVRLCHAGVLRAWTRLEREQR